MNEIIVKRLNGKGIQMASCSGVPMLQFPHVPGRC